MNTKEQADVLMNAIQQLMELYQDITEKIPRLIYNSELKKRTKNRRIRTTYALIANKKRTPKVK